MLSRIRVASRGSTPQSKKAANARHIGTSCCRAEVARARAMSRGTSEVSTHQINRSMSEISQRATRVCQNSVIFEPRLGSSRSAATSTSPSIQKQRAELAKLPTPESWPKRNARSSSRPGLEESERAFKVRASRQKRAGERMHVRPMTSLSDAGFWQNLMPRRRRRGRSPPVCA